MCASRTHSTGWVSIFTRHIVSPIWVARLGCKCVRPGRTARDGCLFSHATLCHPFGWLVLAVNVCIPDAQHETGVYFHTPHCVTQWLVVAVIVFVLDAQHETGVYFHTPHCVTHLGGSSWL